MTAEPKPEMLYLSSGKNHGAAYKQAVHMAKWAQAMADLGHKKVTIEVRCSACPSVKWPENGPAKQEESR